MWKIVEETKDYSSELVRIFLSWRLPSLTVSLTVSVRSCRGFVSITAALSGGHPIGGEVAAEFAARVKAHATVAIHAAGMLPCLPDVVPMEAKLRQLAAISAVPLPWS